MKASHGKGLATHTGPESCAAVREALTGVRAGRVFSRENPLRSADALRRSGRLHPARRHRKTRRSSARSETPGMLEYISRENRESLWLPAVDGTVGRIGKSTDARR